MKHSTLALKIVLVILPITALMFGFQNCEQVPVVGDVPPEVVANEKVVESIPTDTYHQVRLIQSPHLSQPRELFVDLVQKEISDTPAGSDAVSVCRLPDDVALEFQQLLSGADICEPGPLPDGMAVCMAIGFEDIELTNSKGRSHWLRPVICHNGRFLCDGRDALLRELLSELSCE